MRNLPYLKSITTICGLLLIFTFNSCSKAPQHLSVIPKYTHAVMSVDIMSLALKGELNTIQSTDFFKEFERAIHETDKDMAELFDNIISDPAATGLDLTEDLYGFYRPTRNYGVFICYAASVANTSDFESFIKKMAKAADINSKIINESKYNYISIEDFGIAWDNDRALFVQALSWEATEFLEKQADILMSLAPESQITELPVFNSFIDTKQDVSLYLSSNIIGPGIKQLEKELEQDLNDNYLLTHLNFDNGEVVITNQFELNEDMQAEADKNNFLGDGQNGDLLAYLPEQNYGVASVSLDANKFYQVLRKQNDFRAESNYFKEDYGVNFRQIFASLKGNAVLSLIDFKEQVFTYEDWEYSFDESTGKPIESRPLTALLPLNDREKEQLMAGQTIPYYQSGGYGVNIKNLLDEGITLQTAIYEEIPVNWYTGLVDYKKVEHEYTEMIPVMGLIIELENDSVINQFITMSEEYEEISKQDGYYKIEMDDDVDGYLAYNNKVCLITNDKATAVAFKTGGPTQNMSQAEVSGSIIGSPMFITLNLDLKNYPEMVKSEWFNDSRNMAALIEQWGGSFKAISIETVDKKTSKIRIRLSETNQNSLSTIINTIMENA